MDVNSLNSKKLRIGVIINDEMVSSWALLMLEKIKNDPRNDIVIAVKNKVQIKNKLVYKLYEKLDTKFFKVESNALDLADIKKLIDVEILDINHLDKIASYKIDIFINLCFNIPDSSIFNLSKYGVWSYHIGNLDLIGFGYFQFFRDVVSRRGLIEISLIQLLETEIKVIDYSSTTSDKISVNRCRNSCLWKVSSIIPRALDNFNETGEDLFFLNKSVLDKNPNDYLKNNSLPNNFTILLMLVKFKWKRFSNIIRNFIYFDQWVLLFTLEENNPLSNYKIILPPKDRFWADPHVIRKEGIYYIFIEELIYKENKGFISVIEMDSKGNYTEPVIVLEKDYHLSFPFIIEDDGEIYMIPESKQNNNIQLYKCIDFPFKWQLETVLVDNIRAVDTVITKKDNKYWMFTNMAEVKGSSYDDELYLFSSDKLISNNWIPHRENPISSDVRNARMAGSIFFENNKRYRPSQNCSNHYGYGMNINEINEITNEKYQEKIIKSIIPNWDKNITSQP